MTREAGGETWAFELPGGYVDAAGGVHREGRIRRALARDEARALGDFRVSMRPEAYLELLLARTVVSLGSLKPLDAGLFQRLDREDLRYLEDLYRRTNGYDG